MKTPNTYALAVASLALFLAVDAVSATEQVLDEIVVTAELLEQSALALPNSVTVIEQKRIEQRSAQHLEDLLNLAPNVNFSTGASRGRFIQIRGIGERSEFQEPIINSVGVLIDGIDFTGIATAATSLDVKQVEVLRGPQGTLFGANALAGLINIVSNDPSDSFYARIGASVENYSGREFNAVISAPISDNSAYRLAVKNYSSDGFTDNIFLTRDDTSAIDETSARARLNAQPTESLNLGVTVFLADINNGYDAFSLDNTRRTYSDEPGADQQETHAIAVNADYQINPSLRFVSSASMANSELEYSYDEDWSNLGICNNTACDSALFGFDWFYSSFDQYLRDNDNTSIDLKLISKDNADTISWLAGLYYRDQSIDLERNYTFNDDVFVSTLDTSNSAAYGQIDFAFNTALTLSMGLRLEQRDVDYTDNTASNRSTDEDLWGGRIALQYQADSGAFYYGLISRGYKPGGFNLEQSIDGAQREFDTETMLNYEIGVKTSLLDDRLQVQAALFYQDRDAIQSKQSIVASIASGELGNNCPCSFTDFTDNAASGVNRGVELEFSWLVNSQLQLFGSLGLLDTEYDEFLTFEHVDADRDDGVPFNLAGREQAHAPGYQWFVGAEYSFNSLWSVSGSIEAKDDFYFSDRHEERSDAYEMLNLELAYRTDRWQIALYAKNVTDELVKTRGFGSFGNDPRNFYTTEPYNQFAAPRVIGVKASMEF